MMRCFCLSVVTASAIAVTSHSAHADQNLGEVVGTIARTLLEQQQGEHERALWAGVVENGSVAAYRQYLNAYPQGPNAHIAQEQLAKLETATTAETRAAQSEAQLGLTRADREAIQQRLAALGFYKSGIEGAFGAGPRRATAAWQASRELPRSGYLNANQMQVLLDPAGVTPTSTAPVDGRSAISAAQAELHLGLARNQRVRIQRDLTALGYDTKGADGLFGTGTREAIRAWQADGIFESTTRRAIRRWQGDNALSESGYLTAEEVRTLQEQARF